MKLSLVSFVIFLCVLWKSMYNKYCGHRMLVLGLWQPVACIGISTLSPAHNMRYDATRVFPSIELRFNF